MSYPLNPLYNELNVNVLMRNILISEKETYFPNRHNVKQEAFETVQATQQNLDCFLKKKVNKLKRNEVNINTCHVSIMQRVQ
jgi:hypothetical protein